MNEDYLWDRTGEPDEEIEELERVLGELKYQPRRLEIPVGVNVAHKSLYLRALAIAATIAIILLGAGLWRGRQGTLDLRSARTVNSSPADKSLERPAPNSIAAGPVTASAPASTPAATFKRANRSGHSTLTASVNRERLATQAEPKLPANEVAEAQTAKQQLMLALRVVSAKLTVAQKRTQGASTANQIQNQHKTG
jgi:hypothetical protein